MKDSVKRKGIASSAPISSRSNADSPTRSTNPYAVSYQVPTQSERAGIPSSITGDFPLQERFSPQYGQQPKERRVRWVEIAPSTSRKSSRASEAAQRSTIAQPSDLSGRTAGQSQGFFSAPPPPETASRHAHSFTTARRAGAAPAPPLSSPEGASKQAHNVTVAEGSAAPPPPAPERFFEQNQGFSTAQGSAAATRSPTSHSLNPNPIPSKQLPIHPKNTSSSDSSRPARRVLIAVFGMTGTGKTSLIKNLAGDAARKLRTGHGLESCMLNHMECC